MPKVHAELLADSHTGLHEMLQQFVFERSEIPSTRTGLAQGIMRSTKIIAVRDSWIGPSKTVHGAGKVPWRNIPQFEARKAVIAAESNRLMATRPLLN